MSNKKFFNVLLICGPDSFSYVLEIFLGKVNLFFFISKDIALLVIRHISAHLFHLFLTGITLYTFISLGKWLEFKIFSFNYAIIETGLKNKRNNRWSYWNKMIVSQCKDSINTKNIVHFLVYRYDLVANDSKINKEILVMNQNNESLNLTLVSFYPIHVINVFDLSFIITGEGNIGMIRYNNDLGRS